jgi:hypothetical protein
MKFKSSTPCSHKPAAGPCLQLNDCRLHPETQLNLILPRDKWLDSGFGLVIGFIGLLKLVTTITYSAIANSHNLQSSTARIKSLVLTDPNAVDSSVSMFISLQAGDCIIAHHGCSSWPLTPSRVWPPLATTCLPAESPSRLQITHYNWVWVWLWVLCYDRRSIGKSVSE